MEARVPDEKDNLRHSARVSPETRFVIVGGGKMGEAILGGWLAAEEEPAACLSAQNFVVVNPGEERRTYLTERYGVACVADVADTQGADIAVLAVKPQVMRDVLTTVSQMPAYAGAHAPLFVSIAAGLTTEVLLEDLSPEGDPSDAEAPPPRLVRTMPNMPLQVGAGTTAVCASRTSTDDDVALVRDLFACLGSAYVVAEDDMDAVCALSGSGPAYVAAMIEALRDAGVSCGLDGELAEALALDMTYGTCRLMRQTGRSPEDTRTSICSPGGTTLAALSAMDEAGFSRALSQGVLAAAARSRELARC